MKGWLFFFAVGIAAIHADPRADVRAALEGLRKSNYTWETTARQRSSQPPAAEGANRRSEAETPLEVEGKNEPDGYIEVTLLPSPSTVAAPVTALLKFGEAVVHTPLGWLDRNELRKAENNEPDRAMPFEGKSVRLERCLAVARRAITVQTPFEEVFDLIGDTKAYRETTGELIAELTEKTVEKLWGDERAKSAPDIEGTVTYHVSNDILTGYHVRLEIGYPSQPGRPARHSVVEWTTRIRAIGSTTIMPPAVAKEKLER